MINHIILAMSTFPGNNKDYKVSEYFAETGEWMPYEATEVNASSGDSKKLTSSVFSYKFKKSNEEEQIYKIEDCKSQLEPIPKLMMQMYPEKNEEFIIYELCSAETLHEYRVEDGIYSAATYFEERMNLCKDKQERKVRFERILLNDLRSPYEAIKEAMEIVRTDYKEGDEHRLWIDTHGGIRDVAQIFSAIVSLLKVEDIVPEEIFGVEMGKNIIVDQKGAFSIFEYVSGMNDFINFGSADVLNDYYKNTENEKIKSILQAMKEIAGGTQLCDPVGYTKGIENLRKSIQRIGDDPLLGIFSEYIKKDYGKELIPSDGADVTDKIPPLAIVERCVNKGLYQQALTFLESMMPEEYVERKFLYVDESKQPAVEAIKKKEKKAYLTNDHYLFDKYVNSCIYYRYEGSNDTTEETVWAIKQLDDFYRNKAGQYFNNVPADFRRYNKIFDKICKTKYVDNVKTQIPLIEGISTVLSGNDLKIFLQLLQIHKALKACRNLFNHCNGSRPDITEIKNVLQLYIIYARHILK